MKKILVISMLVFSLVAALTSCSDGGNVSSSDGEVATSKTEEVSSKTSSIANTTSAGSGSSNMGSGMGNDIVSGAENAVSNVVSGANSIL